MTNPLDRNRPVDIPREFAVERANPMLSYCDSEVQRMEAFLNDRRVTIERTITAASFAEAKDLTTGVSGAKTIVIAGQKYILKSQNFTETFRANFGTLLAYRANFGASLADSSDITHRKISESDDSYAHFPRKEVLGSTLASKFHLKVPKTELARIEGDGIASLQEFVSEKEAIVMILEGDKLAVADIDFQSIVGTVLFQIATENIDGHSGNVMLRYLPESNDEERIARFEAFPIDYGLILPRNASVYPLETNLIKGVLYKLIENRKIPIKTVTENLPQLDDILCDPVIQRLATDNEKQNLIANLRALHQAASKSPEITTIKDFLDLVIICRIRE